MQRKTCYEPPLKQWEAQGGHERIRVEHRFGQSLPPIRVDREQIKEALMNVLINAGKPCRMAALSP